MIIRFSDIGQALANLRAQKTRRLEEKKRRAQTKKLRTTFD